MKKILIKISFIFLVPLIVVVFINYKYDPGEIMHSRSQQMVEIGLSGKNIAIKAIPSSLHEYKIKMLELYKASNISPDIAVWGSSRTSEFRAKFLPDYSFINLSLPGANIKDYVALYGYCKEHNQLPKNIILGIDPWTFHTRKKVGKGNIFVADTVNKIGVGGPVKQNYIYARQQLGLEPEKSNTIIEKPQAATWLSNFFEFISPSYFQNCLNYWGTEFIKATDKEELTGYSMMYNDGGYALKNISELDDAEVKRKSISYLNNAKGNFFCDAFAKGENMDLFYKLVETLTTKEKINLTIYISPIYPDVYIELMKYEKASIELAVRKKCSELGVKIIGGFNPEPLNLKTTGKEFSDQYHITSIGLTKILSLYNLKFIK